MNEEQLFKLLYFAGGIVLAGTGAYFVVIREVASIKGQLSILVKIFDTVTQNQAEIGKNRGLADKNRKDLNKYFLRLKELEAAVDKPTTGH